MILVDLNQVMIANMMMQIGNHHNAEIDEGMLRHMILNTLRANRKKTRDSSEMDWNAIFTALNNIREELKEFFPYKVIQVETCEADDIIGVITHEEGTELNAGEPILILSGDKDYIQLHKYANVKQYDPTRKRWISNANPEKYLAEHIIKGDSGDGIPNVLSEDNALVMGTRQRPITQKRLAEWADINNMQDEVKRNYMRNKALIDLTEVPKDMKEEILSLWHEENGKDRSQLLNYFIKNKLRNLMECITEF